MGIKQPTDLLLQAIAEKGADQICMHLRSHARRHAQGGEKKKQVQTHTNTRRHTRIAHIT